MFGRKHTRPAVVTTTHTTTAPHRPAHTGGLMSRLRPRRNTPTHTTYVAPGSHTVPRSTGSSFGRRKRTHGTHHHHTTATTTTAVPRRKVSMGDKMSGAMLKLKGSLSGRPGQKAAGTRRMHGTDGRGARRYY